MRLRGHDTHLVRHKSKETLDAEVDKSDAGGQGAPSSQELQRDAGTGTGTPWEPACERQHDERQHDGHQPDGRQRNERPKPAYLERSILRRPDASRGKLQDATLANQQSKSPFPPV
jgi:hypothetical protein